MPLTPDRLAQLAEPKDFKIVRPQRRVTSTQSTPLPQPSEKTNCNKDTPIKQKKTFAEQLQDVDPLIQDDDDKEEDDEEEEGQAPPSIAPMQKSQVTAEPAETEKTDLALPPLNEWRDKIECPACLKTGTLTEYKRNGVKYKCGATLDDKKTCNMVPHPDWIRRQLDGAHVTRAPNANDGLPRAPSFFKQKPAVALNPIADIEKRMTTMKEQFAKIPQNTESRVLADGMLTLFDLFSTLLPQRGAAVPNINTAQPRQAPPQQTTNETSKEASTPSYTDVTKRNLPKQKPHNQQKRPNILDTLPKEKQEEARKALQKSIYHRPTEPISEAEKKHNVRLFVLRLSPMRIAEVKDILYKLGFRKSDIPTISNVGSNLYEFAVNDHYSTNFLKRAQMAGWPVLKGYDSTKPADKSPVPPAVKDNIERAVVQRIARNIHRTPIHRLRRFYLDLAEEKGIATEVKKAVSELEKENANKMTIENIDDDDPPGPSSNIVSQESVSTDVEMSSSVQNE